ncbi:hypothetical protein OS493_006469 [Desmophyllum pertusum]|uniref:Uncharacterized protein n=1 Tax=Desmophyllum pertusum TaxID=174260 RepID=A0A9X0A4Y4_9CNID|nr:hypothetical protein OS493_006469 [Desmophyllum pertusum]
MFFSFQSCFFTLLITNYFSILQGSEVKPIKGETCSFSGPSEFDDGEENPCFKDGLFSAFFDIRLSRRDGVAVGHVETIQFEEEGKRSAYNPELKAAHIRNFRFTKRRGVRSCYGAGEQEWFGGK